MKKFGLLCLALVLALGTLGVGYAMWTDEVTIRGTVTTNTVTLGFTEFDCTEKYEELPWGSGVFHNGEYEGKDVATVTCDYDASSYVKDQATGLEGYRVGTVTIENGYPCHWTFITFVVKNLGTTPVIIQEWQPVDPTGTLKWNAGLMSLCKYNPKTSEYDIPILKFKTVNLVGSQLHQGDEDKAEIDVHIEQPASMNAQYKFDIVITGVQWNESDIPGHTPS